LKTKCATGDDELRILMVRFVCTDLTLTLSTSTGRHVYSSDALFAEGSELRKLTDTISGRVFSPRLTDGVLV
jgi:hypothetical protein